MRLPDLTRDTILESDSKDFVRYLSCTLQSHGGPYSATRLFCESFPQSRHVPLLQKAIVEPGTTTDSAWAGILAAPMVTGFLGVLRARTILDRLATRRVPLNSMVPLQTGTGTYGWVGQGVPTPATQLAFTTTSVGIHKLSAIIVVTNELARRSDPAIIDICRDDMIGGIAAAVDAALLDPTLTAVATVHPASITNGVPPLTSSADPKQDYLALLSALQTSLPGAERPTLIGSPLTLEHIALARQGAAPIVELVASSNAGNKLVLLDAAALLVAEGGLEILPSKSASVQMDSAPMGGPDATVVMTSLWPMNLIGLRATRVITWTKARPGMLAWMDAVVYP
jgi:hypothetical protein